MPKAVTQYETFDGKVFADESRAEQWERDTNKANGVVSMFPNSGHLSSGDYYRIPMQLIHDARNKLCDALQGKVDADAVHNFRNGVHGGILGRYLDDGDSPYRKAYWLFQCIDDQGRMFNQPFFANNPDEAKDEVSY